MKLLAVDERIYVFWDLNHCAMMTTTIRLLNRYIKVTILISYNLVTSLQNDAIWALKMIMIPKCGKHHKMEENVIKHPDGLLTK